MNTNATVIGASALAGVLVLVLLGAAQPDRVRAVSFSEDGVMWSPTLPDTLFDSSLRWVPGDERSTVFHVLNDTDQDGRIRVYATGPNTDFADSLDISLDGARTATSCPFVEVAAGAQKRIDATVVMAVEAGNENQNSSADLDFVVQWDSEENPTCPYDDLDGEQP